MVEHSPVKRVVRGPNPRGGAEIMNIFVQIWQVNAQDVYAVISISYAGVKQDLVKQGIDAYHAKKKQ